MRQSQGMSDRLNLLWGCGRLVNTLTDEHMWRWPGTGREKRATVAASRAAPSASAAAAATRRPSGR